MMLISLLYFDHIIIILQLESAIDVMKDILNGLFQKHTTPILSRIYSNINKPTFKNGIPITLDINTLLLQKEIGSQKACLWFKSLRKCFYNIM